MKDLGEELKYLGINIKCKRDAIELDQKDYLENLLRKYSMENCKPTATPIEPKLELSKENVNNKDLIHRCRKLIGSLMYAMLGTRPDICFALSYLSRYQDCASEDLWKALKRILRYIKGSINLKLIYCSREDRPLLGYTDADWAGNTEDRKSTSGYIMQVYGCTVSWSSSKQQCVALSSTEAEYIALGRGVAEVCWIKNLLQELGIECQQVPVFVDNQSAIQIAKNPEHHKRLKHIDIKYHFVRDKVCLNIVMLFYVPTNEQVADMCTKGLNGVLIKTFCEKLNLRSNEN